jgi:hypothetical protein
MQTCTILQLRKRVPDNLRAAFGKRQGKFSLQMLDPVEAKRSYAAALVALEELRGVAHLLPESTVCNSRGIYGNYLRLPRLIPPCGGTQAAIPHIPAAKTAPGLYGRLPVQSQHPVPQYPVRTLKRERHKEPQQLLRVHTHA